MASKALVLVCILAVVFVIAYAEESASEKTTTVHSNEAEKNVDNKVNGIEDAKYGGYPGGGYSGRGGYPGGGYPGRGGYPGGGYPGRGGYPGGHGNNCRFGCCGRKDYYGNCQRCCPHAV
ncbi:glycine-rich cell wall structural protein [Beta vulgaris subsp. vulgaris]|uniref:glycine-rich cell wall structural protein n=1 Tax=Beta vulgaris subsp. vulgaris TaxID=3555 RepID=UPI0020373730|nr:glycine-rich cell wall structural protein [Beta vulgaris subsp. vulgaris]